MDKYQTFTGRNNVNVDLSKFSVKWKKSDRHDSKAFSDDDEPIVAPIALHQEKTLRKRPSVDKIDPSPSERIRSQIYYDAIEQIFGPGESTSSDSSGEVDRTVEPVSFFYTSLTGDIDVAETPDYEIYAPITQIPTCEDSESELSESEGTCARAKPKRIAKSRVTPSPNSTMQKPVLVKPAPKTSPFINRPCPLLATKAQPETTIKTQVIRNPSIKNSQTNVCPAKEATSSNQKKISLVTRKTVIKLK
ncbi:Hypothetical protein POVR1_LOCUS517 [uncultured virus]|nr:Hypothetical protein POVR1_LOCUS517 [uncultured virus]